MNTSIGFRTNLLVTSIWNIQKLTQAAWLAQLFREMAHCKVKIMDLNKVRWDLTWSTEKCSTKK